MHGELDFAESLHQRVTRWRGCLSAVIGEVREAPQLTPGARTLVSILLKLGLSIGVVSGGFIEIGSLLTAELGISYAHANSLELAEGHLTGEIIGPVV